jgi:hypothetical protein
MKPDPGFSEVDVVISMSGLLVNVRYLRGFNELNQVSTG